MIDLFEPLDVTTEEGLAKFMEKVNILAKDPGMREILDRMFERAIEISKKRNITDHPQVTN